jgi:hypothetical protein
MARLSLVDSHPGALEPKVHSGLSEIKMYFDYAGSKSILELEAEVWTKGKPVPGPRTSQQVINGPRNTLSVSFRQGNPKANWPYHLKTELRCESGRGGILTSDLPLQIPEAATGWVATVPAAVTVDLPESLCVPIWVYITNHEKIELPPGTSLEEWAAKADAALVIRARLPR